MGKIYAKAILHGDRSLDSIGRTWRAATIAALREMASDGVITQEKLAEIVGEAVE